MKIVKILLCTLLFTSISAYAYTEVAPTSQSVQNGSSSDLETIFIPVPPSDQRDGNYHQQIIDNCDIRYQITLINSGYPEGYICVKKK